MKSSTYDSAKDEINFTVSRWPISVSITMNHEGMTIEIIHEDEAAPSGTYHGSK